MPFGSYGSHSEKGLTVSGLLSQKRKILFDSSSLNGAGFLKLVRERETELHCETGQLFVPSFALPALKREAETEVRRLIGQNFVTVLAADGADYAALMPRIAAMNQKRDFCIVANDSGVRKQIIEAARNAGTFVKLLYMDGQGELSETFRYEKTSGTAAPKPKAASFTVCAEPEKMQICPIVLSEKIGEGTTVYGENRREVKLLRQEAVNPNAVTYSTDLAGMWAKLYVPGSLSTFLEEKIKRMLSVKVSYRGLCWPAELLRDRSGQFVGFLMPAAAGEPLHQSVFKQAKLLAWGWTRKDLCDLTLAILGTIRYLHGMNILMGCVNPAAIRVADKNGRPEVCFADTDNYQIDGFPSLVYNASFTPPEFRDKKIYMCGKENENYAVAVLVFMLMMAGRSPYTASSGRSFSFSDAAEPEEGAEPRGMWSFMWSHLSWPLKNAFVQTFRPGGKNEKPENRRDVSNWIGLILGQKEELTRLEELQKTGKLADPIDAESLKIYPRTFKRGRNETFYACKICGVPYPRQYFRIAEQMYRELVPNGAGKQDGDFGSRAFDEYRICNSCMEKRSEVSFTCEICRKTYFYTNRAALYLGAKQKEGWNAQKYCRDCKNKTLPCQECGRQVPYFWLKDGRCVSCNSRRGKMVYKTVLCKNCGASFAITQEEHERNIEKGLREAVYCKACRAERKKAR